MIIIKKNDEVLKEVLGLLRKRKVKTEVYKERSKEEVLSSIEKGAKYASAYLKRQPLFKRCKRPFE